VFVVVLGETHGADHHPPTPPADGAVESADRVLFDVLRTGGKPAAGGEGDGRRRWGGASDGQVISRRASNRIEMKDNRLPLAERANQSQDASRAGHERSRAGNQVTGGR